ncbi:MAG: hypothetical protein RIT04_111 [Candidatus Parcubacteria bacterium]|jgi:hypothetical protein
MRYTCSQEPLPEIPCRASGGYFFFWVAFFLSIVSIINNLTIIMKHTQHLLLVAAFVLFALPSWVSLAQAESTAVNPANLSQISAQVTGMPTLSIVFDQVGKESSLKADFDLSVTAGTSDVFLYKRTAVVDFIPAATGPSVSARKIEAVSLITSLDGAAVRKTDTYRGEYYVIPAGQTRVFTVSASSNLKIMFPGSYRAQLQSVGITTRAIQQAASNPSDSSILPISHFVLPANQTNTKLVVGELSPYIISVNYVASSGSNKMSIIGERFLDGSNFASVFIDGVQIGGVDGTKDGKTLFFPRPALFEGGHNVYVRTSHGASNAVGFTVSATPVSTSTTPVGVTVSVERKPRLELVFGNDRQNYRGREIQGMDFQDRRPHDSEEGALLKATFEVSVNGGKNGVTLHNWSDIQFINKEGAVLYGGSQIIFPIVPVNPREVTSIKNTYGETLFVIPAGKTVRFTQYSTIDPQKIFAGTYRATTRALYGTSNDAGSDKIQFLFEKNETNARTIIGEISPIIIGATPNNPRPGETVSIIGQRLGGSTLKIDDVAVKFKLSNNREFNKEAAVFTMPNIPAGVHRAVFTHKETGSSNIYVFESFSALPTASTTTTTTSTQTSNVLDGIPVRGIWW